MINSISCKELYQWIDEKREFILIDVLPREYYEARHIPGAGNACVYEIVFPDLIKVITQDKKSIIVTYDSSNRSKASLCAAEKLVAMGYGSIYTLSGGIEEWEGSGYPVDISGPEPEDEPILADRSYAIDREKSSVEWTGRNINTKHSGAIDISRGELVVKDGRVTGGSITIDMQTIRNLNIQDRKLNALLVKHLMSDDFFDVGRFPSAGFEITECALLEPSSAGTPNYLMTGILTIKGVSREISIPSFISAGEGGVIRAQAWFDIDRTDWNVNYGSGKLFERLGMHLVNDKISLEFFLTAV
jgi:polyisoprenoid-binding protein YceI/rhodanese-related sulfurtransferase